ncbi:MGMT family protein [Solirubrobacter phytolaccae]|uniref:MGMT family protein n=1 Tax=Solirubrobacter phytolaccae TaxID=1404360 RepID=A0A9X3ND99_9ACTN|nr:MGMT family protein [Solirubrobacter phytolaccae]MDA0183991.1 MGMT family protein [Solirubrobacter phytolaccae]
MSRSTTLEQILTIVESIPAGRVTTYGSIADHVEGASARSVGHTLRTDGHEAPWWRVVNASGRPAPGVEQAARRHFSAEHTPLVEHGDGTYSVDLGAAMWQVSEGGGVDLGNRERIAATP